MRGIDMPGNAKGAFATFALIDLFVYGIAFYYYAVKHNSVAFHGYLCMALFFSVITYFAFWMDLGDED